MTQTAIIEMKLPSLNDYVRLCRGNRYAAAAEKKEIERQLWVYLRKLTPVKSPVHIRFVWREPNDKRDPDNIAFAKKYILDALQLYGILPNDNREWVVGFIDDFESGEYGVAVEMKERGEKNDTN